jgi:hypothetical protein
MCRTLQGVERDSSYNDAGELLEKLQKRCKLAGGIIDVLPSDIADLV